MYQRFYIPMFAVAIAFGGLSAAAPSASAFDDCCPCQFSPGGPCPCAVCGDCGYMKPIHRAQCYNWNRNYAYTDFGAPTALVTPPTAQLQTNYGWGVASSRISRIDHQFQRNYPGEGPFGGPYRSTPKWPSDTTQFGVYYVRGPW